MTNLNNEVCELTVDQLDIVSGGGHVRLSGHGGGLGGELAMISLQSLVSQRQTALQLTSGMMQAMNDTTNTVLQNIGN